MGDGIRGGKTLSLVILFCSILLLSACGSGRDEETPLPQAEEDYVYVAEELTGGKTVGGGGKDFFPSDYKVSGGFLYFICYQTDETSINKININDIKNLDGAEKIFSAPSLRGYTLDSRQNLYLCTMLQGQLSLQGVSPEGRQLFELALDGEVPRTTEVTGCLAADGAGNLYVLAQDVIYRIDEEGNPAGQYSTAEYREDPWGTEYLLEAWTGEVYYVNAGQKTRFFALAGDASRLEEVQVAEGHSGMSDFSLYPGLEQILVAEADGVLYGYGGEGKGLEPLLKWEDSNLNGGHVRQVAQLAEEQLLVSTASDDFAEKQLYLLIRTPVGELPEKESLVLASLFPSDTLQEAVAEFNRMEGPYHVTVESYGADSWYIGNREENKDAYARLDSSISSGTQPPDLLDLSYLDFRKYAEKEAFADLYPYLDKSALGREDFLDNLLEGYTVDGKLLCLPKKFSFETVAGRTAEVGGMAGWTAEELMDAADERPEGPVVDNQDAADMTGILFGDYCLEGFIDWDGKTCDFDGEEFRRLLQWSKEKAGEGAFSLSYSQRTPQELFLRDSRFDSFLDHLSLAMGFGEDITLVGFPSEDGTVGIKVTINDALSIMESSPRKEGAWAFLEYYLSREEDVDLQEGFFTRKSLLKQQAESAAEPLYVSDGAGGRLVGEDGSYVTMPKGHIYVEGEPISFDCVPREQVDAILKIIENIDFAPPSAQEELVLNIITEEASGYFVGRKSLDETVGIIQNRVQVLLGEDR